MYVCCFSLSLACPLQAVSHTPAGKPIPTELRSKAHEIKHLVDLDDDKIGDINADRDDEYRLAGVHDPVVMVTTSREPSSRLKQFAKEVRLLIPNAQRMNRGGHVVEDLVKACQAHEVSDLVIVHEHRGEPDALIISHMPFGPTAYFTLSNVVMRHDLPEPGTMSEAYPHLIFHNFSSDVGKRVQNILKYIFPVPKDESKRVVTFANRDDFISFRHHVYTKKGRDVELAEVGPRMEMKRMCVRVISTL